MQEGKSTIITGGSRGIGFRIALALAKQKYNIAICSRNLSEAMQASKKIKSLGVRCLALKTDVSNYTECNYLVKKVIKQFSRIDLLVNNAGIQGPIGKLWKNNLKDWERAIRTNLLGTVYMSSLVIPYMLKQKSGKIINLSGGGSTYSRPLFTAYACSKTALLRLTETLQEELKGTGIFVFAVAPGLTWTNMTKETLRNKSKLDKKIILELKSARKSGGVPQNKLEDLICYLLSKSSKKIAGKLIHVNELSKVLSKRACINSEGGLLRRLDYC